MIDIGDEKIEELRSDRRVKSTWKLQLNAVVNDAAINFTFGIGSNKPLRAQRVEDAWRIGIGGHSPQEILGVIVFFAGVQVDRQLWMLVCHIWDVIKADGIEADTSGSCEAASYILAVLADLCVTGRFISIAAGHILNELWVRIDILNDPEKEMRIEW